MQSDYTFLTDHSYSIRLDDEKLSLKNRRKNSNRSTNKTKTNNRTVSIDRGSSDKENNSSVPLINTSGNKRESSMKKKTTTGSRSQLNKKQNNKTQSKILKQKKSIIKSFIDTNDTLPSLSIEERVKLRRTKPLIISNKPVSQIKKSHSIKKSLQQNKNPIKPKKFFLGSGLDLDNIVLGNRQRRSVQT